MDEFKKSVNNFDQLLMRFFKETGKYIKFRKWQNDMVSCRYIYMLTDFLWKCYLFTSQQFANKFLIPDFFTPYYKATASVTVISLSNGKINTCDYHVNGFDYQRSCFLVGNSNFPIIPERIKSINGKTFSASQFRSQLIDWADRSYRCTFKPDYLEIIKKLKDERRL